MKKIIFLFLFGLWLLLAPGAQGAQFFFKQSPATVIVGDELRLTLFVNTDQEWLNALGGQINYDPDFLELKNPATGNSIVNLWVQEPQLNPGAGGQVVFSGMTPGGFNETEGQILSLIFTAKKSGATKIFLPEASALLNDGRGTAVTSTVRIYQLEILVPPAGQKPATLAEPSDQNPPENFIAQIGQDKNVYNGKYFLFFNAQDKNSGLDHFEILEQRNYKIFGLNWRTGGWQEAASPYLLRDQALRSDIFIKAIDRAGNEQTITLPASRPPEWYENLQFWGIIIVAIVLSLLGGKIYAKKFKHP